MFAWLSRYRSSGARRDHKGTQETFGDDGCVHYLDHGDDPWVFTNGKMYQLVQFKYV